MLYGRNGSAHSGSPGYQAEVSVPPSGLFLLFCKPDAGQACSMPECLRFTHRKSETAPSRRPETARTLPALPCHLPRNDKTYRASAC
jgi:hypothetical protein